MELGRLPRTQMTYKSIGQSTLVPNTAANRSWGLLAGGFSCADLCQQLKLRRQTWVICSFDIDESLLASPFTCKSSIRITCKVSGVKHGSVRPLCMASMPFPQVLLRPPSCLEPETLHWKIGSWNRTAKKSWPPRLREAQQGLPAPHIGRSQLGCCTSPQIHCKMLLATKYIKITWNCNDWI